MPSPGSTAGVTAAALLAAILALTTLTSLALTASSSAATGPHAKPGPPAPWFCHGIECPPFKTVTTEPGAYEVRAYGRTVWASTVVEAYSLATAQAAGFRRLFAYISGANAGNVTLAMTAPVLTAIAHPPPAGPFCAANFTISFYVPSSAAASPPRPADPAVFISVLPAGTVYVAARGGWAWSVDAAVAQAAAALTAAVRSDGRPVDKKAPWFTAGYDPPFRLRGRHTEVWVTAPKEGEGEEEEEEGGGGGGEGVART